MFSTRDRSLLPAGRTCFARCTALFVFLSGLLWPQYGYAQQGVQPQLPAGTKASSDHEAKQSSTPPTIRVPYFADRANPGQGAIFWFGKVQPEANYSDVRIAYDDDALVFIMHVFDRRVFYDEKSNADNDLTKYDSASLYIDTQSDLTAPLAANSRRFDAAVSSWETRDRYQRAYSWDGVRWQAASSDFETKSGYRGNPNDDSDDRGWTMHYRVPFVSLGLLAPPAKGLTLRMALFMHDRDELDRPVLPDLSWPHDARQEQPVTWGHITLGVPSYSAPYVNDPQRASIRHGIDGAVAPDAAVGGHSTCGTEYDPNFFDGWGEANYNGFAQFNIQNQWDVADSPCFAKYYVTFPLNALPYPSAIVSATLTMYMFGNAGYEAGDSKPSYMQVARVSEDWSEQMLTWNNAPPVLENYSWSWVDPMETANDHPGKPRTWDLSRAVADAHAIRQPLRLVIYSTDGDYHSGKYFWSGDAGESVRPRLDISWGNPGYMLETVASKQMIRSGETAQYDLSISALRDGESVTIEVGPSTPEGLNISVSQVQVPAPGGNVVVTLTDTNGSQEARVYRVPVTARNGNDIRTTEFVIFVNGRQIYLPAVKR
jgi:hypothetical protein